MTCLARRSQSEHRLCDKVSRVGSPLNGAVSDLLPPKNRLKPPVKPSCDGLRIAWAPGSPPGTDSLLAVEPAFGPRWLSSLGINGRLAATGSLLSFFLCAI